MATNQYGIDSSLWNMLSPEDQNQIISDYNKAHAVPYTPPAIGGYAPPPPGSAAETALNQVNAGGPAPAPTVSTNNPKWVWAVNMPSTYPDFAAMKQAGSGLIVVEDDPNADMLVAAARQWGIPVSIHVNAPNDISPEDFAARVAAAKQRFNPDMLLLDIEGMHQLNASSEWSNQVAALIKPIVGGTQLAVSMEQYQSEYNYKAYLSLGAQIWPQTYGNQNPQDAVDMLTRLGVPRDQIVAVLDQGSTGAGVSGPWASYGIPNTSAGGIYATYGTTGTVGTSAYPGLTPVGGNTTPGTGPGPHVPGEIPTTGPTGPGSPTPPVPGGTTTQGTGTATAAGNWAAAYFGNLGLPPDVAAQVNNIFNKYSDTTQAINFALAYIRGTPWYAQTFPGINYGIQHGLIANEQDYRQYVTALDTLSQRYWGRHISGSEVSSYLFAGLTPDIVGKQYEGLANVQAYGKDYSYYLGNIGGTGQPTNEQLIALGNEQAGLDTALGQQLQRSFQQALQRYSKLFEGQSATPSLSLSQGGLSAPSLATRQKPDIAA